jgi:hypothetical protein
MRGGTETRAGYCLPLHWEALAPLGGEQNGESRARRKLLTCRLSSFSNHDFKRGIVLEGSGA